MKKKFNEYQIETVIHENYEMNQISKLVRLYNNHTSMNTSQKAFTYIDVFAREIRRILENQFFINNTSYKTKERQNGTLERIVQESVMCMFHFEHWKRQSKQLSAYLNKNATEEQFKILDRILSRLENILTSDLYSIFTSKDTFIWMALFHKFTNSGLEDCKFAEFLTAFKAEKIDSATFYTLDKGHSTKDKYIVESKLDILVTLMCDYLHIDRKDLEDTTLNFVRDNINQDTTQEDMEFYKDMLNDYASRMDSNSKLLDKQNQTSLIAIIAYACNRDMEIDNWFIDYFDRNDSYLDDQVENFLYMKNDMENFMSLLNIA